METFHLLIHMERERLCVSMAVCVFVCPCVCACVFVSLICSHRGVQAVIRQTAEQSTGLHLKKRRKKRGSKEREAVESRLALASACSVCPTGVDTWPVLCYLLIILFPTVELPQVDSLPLYSRPLSSLQFHLRNLYYVKPSLYPICHCLRTGSRHFSPKDMF